MKYRVNIDAANKTKKSFSGIIDNKNKNILNKVGAFSSLYQLDVSNCPDPVLVFKTEEPGSKQILALKNDRVESICEDMINHLINDCIVMGATPLIIQDLIVCGFLDSDIVKRIVKGCSEAALKQGCVLCGGETSEQPGIIEKGKYILGSSIVGLVSRNKIIDGSRIEEGDVVISVNSSGPHTNGYTLIRDLLSKNPSLEKEIIDGQSFLDLILAPHRCYYNSLKDLFPESCINGLAHITGGGIGENLNRILPENLDALIDLSRYDIPPVFKKIQELSGSSSEEMLRVFNLGVGITIVCSPANSKRIMDHLTGNGEQVREIGTIIKGKGAVRYKNSLKFS